MYVVMCMYESLFTHLPSCVVGKVVCMYLCMSMVVNNCVCLPHLSGRCAKMFGRVCVCMHGQNVYDRMCEYVVVGLLLPVMIWLLPL